MTASRVVFYLAAAVLMAFSTGYAGQISRYVVDQNNDPVRNAIVRFQASSVSTKSDKKGAFSLQLPKDTFPRVITAWKQGYFNGGQKILNHQDDCRIVLSRISFSDNPDYQWLQLGLPPGSPSEQASGLPSTGLQKEEHDGSTEESQPCQVCHPQITEEWKKDAHSSSAVNPVFLSFYNGTDLKNTKDAGPGFKKRL